MLPTLRHPTRSVIAPLMFPLTPWAKVSAAVANKKVTMPNKILNRLPFRLYSGRTQKAHNILQNFGGWQRNVSPGFRLLHKWVVGLRTKLQELCRLIATVVDLLLQLFSLEFPRSVLLRSFHILESYPNT